MAAKVRKSLTDATIKNAKPKANRYRLRDGHGLHLEVSAAGGRYWRYRYELPVGTENLYAAGEWCAAPDGETPEQAADRRAAGRFTLAEARIERLKWRDMVKRGQHPKAARDAERQARTESNANTFEAVTTEFVAKRSANWSGTHLSRFNRFMKKNVFPSIGTTPIRDVTGLQLLAILRKVEERGATSLAGLGRSFIGQVFRYAVATGKADNDPSVALRGALAPHLVKHHKPLERATIPEFFEALREKSGAKRQTEIAIRLLAYLFSRPGELRAAPWPEFDLDAAEWRIPGNRMKKKTPHVVPLPTQAVELLRELHTITGRRPWLLPNARTPNKPMSLNGLNGAITRAGFGAGEFSAHGFRATASTMLHEAGFDTRLIELQLAHKDRNKSRASYDHSARLPERREMMQWWANTLDALTQPKSNVVMMKAANT